jgi:hypothetical protein
MCKYRNPVAGEQGCAQLDDGHKSTLNWGLIVAVVLCVEFWIAVTSAALDL